MRCPRCGAVLRDDAEQCGFCGEKIVPVISFEKPIIENRPRDEAFDVENTVQKAAQPEERNHDQNPLIIMIIILSGVLFAAVAVLLFYAVRNSQRAVVNLNQTSSVSEETETETTPLETTATSAEEASEDSTERRRRRRKRSRRPRETLREQTLPARRPHRPSTMTGNTGTSSIASAETRRS